jgi:hypothetical protein
MPYSPSKSHSIIVHQIIELRADGRHTIGQNAHPISLGVHTSPHQARACGRRSGSRSLLIDLTLYPQPVKITYGMTAPKWRII